MRVRREEWAKRVERWKDSGLTAKEFATELGIKPRALMFWKWQLSRGAGHEAKESAPNEVAAPRRARRAKRLPLIELTAPAAPSAFELDVGGGCRLMIPAKFDAASLRRLLVVLGRAS
jgi:transposase-like protein